MFQARSFNPALLTLVAWLSSSPIAQAQTLFLNSGGSIVASPNNGGSALVTGPEGFTFFGFASDAGVQALSNCASPTCRPGTAVTLEATFVGSDTIGTATYRGTTYRAVGGINSANTVYFHTAGLAFMPPMSDRATVSAPFSLDGELVLGGVTLPVVASGRAELSLSRKFVQDPNAWGIDSITF